KEPLLVCKNGDMIQATPNYDHLETIIAAGADPDFNVRQAHGLLRYHVAVTPQYRAYRHLYATYPMVHADVMHELLEFAIDEVFPWDTHEIFLHLKGHGTPQLALTALDAAALAERIDTQTSAWDARTAREGVTTPLPEL